MTSGSHQDLADLAAGYVLGALEPDERRDFETHLAECSSCTSSVRWLSEIELDLARSVPRGTPRPELRGQVLRTASMMLTPAAWPGEVNSIAGAGRGGAGAGLSTFARRLRWTHRSASRGGGPAGPSWLPVAAALALAAGLGLYVVLLHQRIADLEVRLAQATSRILVADQAVTDARRVAVQSQSAAEILLAPDVARIELRGEGSAPDAMARALWSRQRGMVFTATNLPPLPAGRTYQVWVVTATAPLSAGVIEPDTDGRARGVFSTPPDIPPPLAVAVTVEPAGGVPAPTGPRMLLGAVSG
jgi:anti-sigma-K factor RskA